MAGTRSLSSGARFARPGGFAHPAMLGRNQQVWLVACRYETMLLDVRFGCAP